MKRSKNSATPKRNHLLKSLQYLKDDSTFVELPNDQWRLLESAYSKLKRIRGIEWSINITPFEIPIKNLKLRSHQPTFLIGGVIIGRGDEITWSSLSVCVTFTSKSSRTLGTNVDEGCPGLNVSSCCISHCDNKKRIVRRFHFDYQPHERDKPTSHLQYGGKVPGVLFPDIHYCLEHFLENPRIHYPPMDLVLILDVMLREFDTPITKIKEEPNWKSLVKKSQELWWKDYYTLCYQYCSTNQKETIHERMYNETWTF